MIIALLGLGCAGPTETPADHGAETPAEPGVEGADAQARRAGELPPGPRSGLPITPRDVVVGSDPTPELMEQVSRGEVPMAALLDAKRGFVEIEVRGTERRAERVCGNRAEERASALQSDLQDRSAKGEREGLFTCSGPVCTHPGDAPDDFHGSYSFQSPEGELVLGLVVRIAEAPEEEAPRKKLEAWVDEHVAELLGKACPEPEGPARAPEKPAPLKRRPPRGGLPPR